MMRKLYVWLLTCMVVAVVSLPGMSQDRQLSGRVLDENQNGLPGASILVKNTTKGTSADAEGNFSITVSGSGVLTISSLGYEPQEFAFNGSTSTLEAVLKPDARLLGEVVVTALGIKRDKKSLTYATQQIGGQELTRAANTNFVDALNGKAAGVDIKVSSSGAGGSTRADHQRE